MILKSRNELGASVLLVLAWIAMSDGSIDSSEYYHLENIAHQSNSQISVDEIIDVLSKEYLEAIQLSCEIIEKYYDIEKSNLFIEMIIGIALVDGYLLPTENYIIRFLADLLNISFKELNEKFVQFTGEGIPDPSDVSKACFWKAREESQKRQQKNKAYSEDQKIMDCYAILGLHYGASKEDIKYAFRELAKKHHPDKFASLGKEGQAAAQDTFQKIKEARDYLLNYA